MSFRLQGLWEINKSSGIEVSFNHDGEILFALCIVEKVKEELLTVYSKSDQSLAECIAQIPDDIPVILSVTGKGILFKKLNASSVQQMDTVPASILPSANNDLFYSQLFRIGEERELASIIRKEPLDNIINQLNNAGKNVVGCYIGQLGIQSIAQLLRIEPDGWFILGNSRIHFKDNVMDDLEQSDNFVNTVIVNGAAESSAVVSAYAAAFSWFSPIQQLSNNVNAINDSRQIFRSRLKLKRNAVLMAISVFTIVLINAIVFLFLFDRNSQYQYQISVNSADMYLADSLSAVLKDHSDFFSSSNVSGVSKTSFYADRIAASLPQSVNLIQLNINKRIISDDQDFYLFDNKKIEIKGNAESSSDLTTWIRDLKNMKWAKDVSLINYTKSDMAKPGSFLIEIHLQ